RCTPRARAERAAQPIPKNRARARPASRMCARRGGGRHPSRGSYVRTAPHRPPPRLARCPPRRGAREPLEAPGAGSIACRGFLQLLGVEERNPLVEDLAGVALEHVVQAMRGEVDAMVRDTALREVVGSYLLRPFAGADLAAPLLGDRLLLLAHLHL